MTHPDVYAPRTRSEWILQLLGWLALIASLLLLSPGVVTRANAEASSEDGPACRVERDDETQAAELDHLIEALRAQALAHAEAAREAGDEEQAIVLNGRGYNYSNGPALSGE